MAEAKDEKGNGGAQLSNDILNVKFLDARGGEPTIASRLEFDARMRAALAANSALRLAK
ncbi:MAG: hypothetical protein AB7H77_10150 [Bdellovibrionales bacterium]